MPDPAKVIAEALRGWLPVSLADRALAQDLAEAVLAALAAAGFPVGEPRDVDAIIERAATELRDIESRGILTAEVAQGVMGDAVREAAPLAGSARPAPEKPEAVVLAFWECGHVEIDRGVEHPCPLDVCRATYAPYFAASSHEPPIPWGRVRERLLSDEAVEAAVSAIEIVDDRICKETQGACVCAGERKQALAALAAAVDHAEKGAS